MDDFNINALHESKNEWTCRLINILTPLIIEGLRSIFDESSQLCSSNGEMDKYLMTFQNFISRIPKWNPNIIEEEKCRIVEKSRCPYLEDLITCVHIIQLKVLTAVRVGQKQKKINLDIPKLDIFIHKVYIQVARKVYQNVYLFEINIPPLKTQKNNRNLEIMIQESILNAVRESIPVDTILKAYMDETIEEDVIEEIKEKEINETDEIKKLKKAKETPSKIVEEERPTPKLEEKTYISSYEDLSDSDEEDNNKSKPSSIVFNDIDMVRDIDNNDNNIMAPKTFERLDEISNMRNEQRKMDDSDDDDDDDDEPIKLKISDNSVSISDLGLQSIEPVILDEDIDLLSGLIEELPNL
jgi:hypothetical protein